MAWFDIIWNYVDEDGNVEHVAQHDLTPEDVNEVLENPIREEISESSGRPIAFGYTPDGRLIAVVYEEIDDCTLYPATAYVIGE